MSLLRVPSPYRPVSRRGSVDIETQKLLAEIVSASTPHVCVDLASGLVSTDRPTPRHRTTSRAQTSDAQFNLLRGSPARHRPSTLALRGDIPPTAFKGSRWVSMRPKTARPPFVPPPKIHDRFKIPPFAERRYGETSKRTDPRPAGSANTSAIDLTDVSDDDESDLARAEDQVPEAKRRRLSITPKPEPGEPIGLSPAAISKPPHDVSDATAPLDAASILNRLQATTSSSAVHEPPNEVPKGKQSETDQEANDTQPQDSPFPHTRSSQGASSPRLDTKRSKTVLHIANKKTVSIGPV